jgi:hypothetical protein
MKQLNIRVTEEDKALLTKNSAELGISLTAYIHLILTLGRLPSIKK